MPGLEICVVYNKVTGETYIVKGKRVAERISRTANKFYKLTNSKEITICEVAASFFKDYHVDKKNIKFCWKTTTFEKMKLYKEFFNYKYKVT